jgi:arginine-tRNA-protein transferase
VVFDRIHECPYLALRPARLPLRLPARTLRADELDQRLAAGDRRQGPVLYRTHCPACSACVPLRIDVERFSLSRTHRRTLARCGRELTLEFGPPIVDAARIDLYNRHKFERGLGDAESGIDEAGYRTFLVDTCCDSFELRMFYEDRLIAVSVLDRGFSSLSAVYCYYDPDYSDLSLGTFAILKEIELCRAWGMRYLYLGLYVEGSVPMVYKARFLPNQQRRGGRWVSVEEPPPPISSFAAPLPCFQMQLDLPLEDASDSEDDDPDPDEDDPDDE